ncbi:Teichoic acids export ATP-binding protein TagH [Posidoniimonas polymericola]|uniref:Teichoic acids export ATP-binding protein TagH n=2 Tax=Posidoniimonas polymericola TaxID=2528002 RepID=A0A5C5ZH85_9BACT|nr:Teichoic acids export ATP-binding protein TagH [Posidoniimonas polymericola]
MIAAAGIGKAYRLGQQEERFTTFGDALVGAVKAPLKRFRQLSGGGGSSLFWALKDVSFEVRQGEVVGIIGRNGAGKSTLLKVLSRITRPTAGRAVMRGRVASLLEVGTGFHPELSGRENIYLNGSILGMRKTEIDRKFDEIVDFSEVEKFLDTPVKRYSSGMYVRLAFAVAAHLEPEILIVDEVLAVGDAQFQKKCLGKMQEVSQGEGRTVLFVSHNMAAVKRLCNRGLFVSQGSIQVDGNVDDAVDAYSRFFQTYDDAPESGECDVAVVDSVSVTGPGEGMVESGKPCRFRVHQRVKPGYENLAFRVRVFDQRGVNAFGVSTEDISADKTLEADEPLSVDLSMDRLQLTPGNYAVVCEWVDRVTWKNYTLDKMFPFTVESSGEVYDIPLMFEKHGLLLPQAEFSVARA